MPEIDIETGLPQLPEDYYWRVQKETTRWGAFNDYFVVEIVHRWVRKEKRRGDIFFGFIPWGWYETTIVETQVEISQGVWDRTKPRDEEADDKFTGIVFVLDTEKYEAKDSDFVTAEDILMAANRAMERFTMKRAADALIGNYPPNKLVANGP